MAEIFPFAGIHYNPLLIEDWSSVICPPHDIITPQMQQELYLASEYNFVRLEFGRELPQDTVTANRYTRASETMQHWLEQGILEVDEIPAIYLHVHSFRYNGEQFNRRGIAVRVRLEDWDKMVIRPHEGTMSGPKSDRLSLLRTLKVNTSPILAMYRDTGQQISSLLAAQEQGQPLVSFQGAGDENHVLRAITDPAVIERITACLADEPLYIADGHHRYESALAYQREQMALAGACGSEAFNFVMMTLVDFADPGLLILPPHRLVRGISQPALDGLPGKLEAFFDIETLSMGAPGVWQRVDGLLAEAGSIRLVLAGLTAGNLSVLTLRDPSAVIPMMPYFHSELYQRLDVSIVDHVILGNLLALSDQHDQAILDYSYSRQEAINRVSSQEYQLACLVSPVKSGVIKAIADAGDRMPKKSTYFYPKLPAGLLINSLV